MGTNDQRQNDGGNDQIQTGELLGKEVALTKSIVVGVVSVFKRNSGQVDIEQNSDQGGGLYDLVKPIPTPVYHVLSMKLLVQRQITATVPNCNCSAQENNCITLKRFK